MAPRTEDLKISHSGHLPVKTRARGLPRGVVAVTLGDDAVKLELFTAATSGAAISKDDAESGHRSGCPLTLTPGHNRAGVLEVGAGIRAILRLPPCI